MSDIVWGPPIEVDGKGPMPEWLGNVWQYQTIGCTDCWHEWQPWWADVVRVRLPATHPHYATLQREGQECDAGEWVPDERTVRVCIEAVNGGSFSYGREDAVRALEALLPKPDPADELIRDYFENGCAVLGASLAESRAALADLARFLISTGRLRP